MTIQSIYHQYKIPPNLERHMLQVTAVGRYVCRHWSAEPMNMDRVTVALLLHDMGNILKFTRPFLGELEKDALYWNSIQEQFAQTYGWDVHTATCRIAVELGRGECVEIFNAMKDGAFGTQSPINWESRICEFADCCVSPEGIVGFEKRLVDLMTRYHRTADELWTRTMRENALLVQKNMDVRIDEVSSHLYTEEIAALRFYDV